MRSSSEPVVGHALCGAPEEAEGEQQRGPVVKSQAHKERLAVHVFVELRVRLDDASVHVRPGWCVARVVSVVAAAAVVVLITVVVVCTRLELPERKHHLALVEVPDHLELDRDKDQGRCPDVV